MNFDHDSIGDLRERHAAWRLLAADTAPMVICFLHRMFIAPNVRMISASELASALADDLMLCRERQDTEGYKDDPDDYLIRWSNPTVGWLRRFYPPDKDEPYFDLTPATEKAIAFLGTLEGRSFVGTESRLLTIVELLRQMSEGVETDPAKRVAELQRRRDEVDEQIQRIMVGDVPLLGDTELKDRFQQFAQIERELLSDFREVEHNFRLLDRRVHERIALWEGGKGALLDEVLKERNAIANSDQGRSFRGFWDFLMSGRRKEEFQRMLEQVLTHPTIADTNPDKRLWRILSNWLTAGGSAQRTIASLSQQLRRFIDDKARLENRRIMDILSGIEKKSFAVRGNQPVGNFMEMEEPWADLGLPMERPLYTPPIKPVFGDVKIEVDDEDVSIEALFGSAVVDKGACIRNVEEALAGLRQVTLTELLERHPLKHGLAEIITYMQLGITEFADSAAISDTAVDEIAWTGHNRDRDIEEPVSRVAMIPRLVFVRRD